MRTTSNGESFVVHIDVVAAKVAAVGSVGAAIGGLVASVGSVGPVERVVLRAVDFDLFTLRNDGVALGVDERESDKATEDLGHHHLGCTGLGIDVLLANNVALLFLGISTAQSGNLTSTYSVFGNKCDVLPLGVESPPVDPETNEV
ncbi:hypothetical protein NP233_g8141 [Leucocoprinus birnbaumii]|uniref:Uncharacterized protein n=1 Tax=Leucocoprinus birnbaumii TaxID=56174 RepID=A0AAD5VNM0_9AGAR|nr:hypothetical protein NP233_g8141 [Leucocoprinus birnbaumii]